MSGENETNTGPGKPFILERPLWRGVFNGIVLCCSAPSIRDGSAPTYHRAVIYGVVFGLVMYQTRT